MGQKDLQGMQEPATAHHLPNSLFTESHTHTQIQQLHETVAHFYYMKAHSTNALYSKAWMKKNPNTLVWLSKMVLSQHFCTGC
jgi:hypothetical protein